MSIIASPIRAFAERVCINLGKLDHETVREEQTIAEGQFSCVVDGKQTPVTIRFLYECGEFICRLKPTLDETDKREREIILFEEIDPGEEDSLPDSSEELNQTQIFNRVYKCITTIMK